MKDYIVKKEFWDNWGASNNTEAMVDDEMIGVLSDEWEIPIEELMKQVEELSDADAVAAKIRRSPGWDIELLKELCKLANLEEEWEAADEYTFESVAFRAAEILGVEIL